METYSSFINKYNLINVTSDNNVSEKTLLFSIENYLLNKNHCTIDDIDLYIDLLEVDKGLYDNVIGIPFHGKDLYTSHDQILAIVAFSLLTGKDYHIKIWEWLKSHYMTYDNVTEETNFSRILHPRDMIFFGYCAGSKICKILLPVLTIIMLISCFGKGSSGKLLNYVRCKPANLRITFWLCTQIIKLNKNFGSWEKVFNTYFPNPNHPNHIGE